MICCRQTSNRCKKRLLPLMRMVLNDGIGRVAAALRKKDIRSFHTWEIRQVWSNFAIYIAEEAVYMFLSGIAGPQFIVQVCAISALSRSSTPNHAIELQRHRKEHVHRPPRQCICEIAPDLPNFPSMKRADVLLPERGGNPSYTIVQNHSHQR